MAGDIWETQTAYTFNLGQEDVVMVISNQEAPASSDPGRGAKENGCTVILITNNGNSPLAGICDYKIVTATREKLLTEEFLVFQGDGYGSDGDTYLLLRAGMKGSMEHIRRHEKAISPDKK